MDLQGKVVAVTGGGDGIGRQLVLELLRRGAGVAAIDLREESLSETAELAGAGDRLVSFAADVTDRERVAGLPTEIEVSLGPVDVLIHNAGIIQPFVKLNDLDYEAIQRVIDVNLYGTIYVVKEFLPMLLSRPEAHVATVSSMGGFLPVPGQTIYGATKAGVKLLTEGLFAELHGTRVGVSVIMPGAVMTDITANSGVSTPSVEGNGTSRGTSPEEAARIILDGIEAGRLHIFVGRDSRTMNLFSRLAPRRSTLLIQRQMEGLLATDPT
jgi:NAD(P)-dependent dehydrogenase (short-subunit alcohol dehydrogenase family)